MKDGEWKGHVAGAATICDDCNDVIDAATVYMRRVIDRRGAPCVERLHMACYAGRQRGGVTNFFSGRGGASAAACKGKNPYQTAQQAYRVAARCHTGTKHRRYGAVEIYRCRDCGAFHLGRDGQ